MTIEAAIYTRLTGHAGTAALVSTRVYPDHLPQKPSYPSISYTRASTDRVSAMGADTGNVAATFTVTCHGTTYASAKTVALQVLDALQRYSATVGGVVIDDVMVVDQSYDFDDDTSVYEIEIDFLFWYRE